MTTQAFQSRQGTQVLRVLAELSPAHPAAETRPLLAAAAEGAQALLTLATRKSDTLLLRVAAPAAARARGGALTMVLKVYGDAHPGQGDSMERAGREAWALARLGQAGVLTPRLVGSSHRALLRLYVDGPVLRDVHWNPMLACELAEWVFRCHEALAVDRAVDGVREEGIAHSWLVGDMNLGNFVIDVSSGRLCGIDMGDTRVGDRLDDVGEGCMRIVSHRPGFTADRWECAVAFAMRYGQLVGDVESVLSQVPARAAASFRQMAVWRNERFMAELAEAFPLLWGDAVFSCGLGLKNWNHTADRG